jgi:hypothetical protein
MIDYKGTYADYRHAAKRRALEFTLTIEDATLLFSSDCVYCGMPPSNIKKKGRKKILVAYLYSSIDRVDSNKGYIKENCVSCCKICNRAKMAMEYNEWMNWIERISLNNVQRLFRKEVEPSGSKWETPHLEIKGDDIV